MEDHTARHLHLRQAKTMKRTVLAGMIVLAMGVAVAGPWMNPVETTAGKYPYAPVALNDVKVTGGFWLPRIETNRLVTVRTDFAKCEETGRIANFEKAGKREKGGFKGVPWDDSDVYKVIEGAAYTLAQHPDAELDRYLDGLIAKIASAQESDGYLYTARTLGHTAAMMGPKPFSRNRDACELYNVGHLYEAAVAHYEVTGKRALLDVAIKNADLVAKTFGLGEGQSQSSTNPKAELCPAFLSDRPLTRKKEIV